MKKLFYVLGTAMLLSSATVTFTGCLDNDEPDGINAMRTAKAEWYSANAAYRLAETENEKARTELTLQQVELLKLQVEAGKIANEIAVVQAGLTKDSLALRLDEIKQEHETKMLDLAKDYNVADKNYQESIKTLQLALATINGEYTDALYKLLKEITVNRDSYRAKVAELTEANLEKMALVADVDSATIVSKMELAIAKADKKVENLEKQKDLLTSINGIDESDIKTKMAELDKSIRENVVVYNQKAAEVAALKTKEKKEADEASNEEKLLGDARLATYNTTEKESFTVANEILNDFITELSLTTDKNVKKEEVIYRGNTITNYSFKSGSFDLEKTVSDVTNPNSVSSSATALLSAELAKLISNTPTVGAIYAETKTAINTLLVQENVNGSFPNEEAFDEAYARMKAREDRTAAFKTLYTADLSAWNTAKSNYTTAANAYNYSSGESLYEYAEEVKAKYDALATAAQTDAEKNNLVAVLKKYAEARQKFDGWAHVTGTAETWKSLTKDNIEAEWVNVLGSSVLNATGFHTIATADDVDFEKQPYGAFIKASNKAFGTTGIANVVFTAPEDAKELEASTITGGSYATYFAEYKKVVNFKKANAWKTIYEAVAAKSVVYANKVTALNDQIEADKATVKPLKDLAAATKNEYTLLSAQYGATALNVKYEDEKDAADKVIGKKLTIAALNATGYFGAYLNNMVTAHNSLASGITNYQAEFDGVSDALQTAKEELAQSKEDLAIFKDGGYKQEGVTDFLKVLIEKADNKIAKIEEEMEDLDGEHESLKKELASLTAIIDANFN